jgi:segregation and condensation protein B
MTTKTDTLQSALEAMLFVSPEPVALTALVELLESTRDEIEEALSALRTAYESPERGLALILHEGAVELVTRPEHGALIEKWRKSKTQESLSKVALEVLSVIAYRGPITRTEIESIRGVNCQYTLRNLLMRGLIERRDEDAVRGYSYVVSFDFLHHIGIERVEALPEYEALSRDERLTAVLGESTPPSPEAI